MPKGRFRAAAILKKRAAKAAAMQTPGYSSRYARKSESGKVFQHVTHESGRPCYNRDCPHCGGFYLYPTVWDIPNPDWPDWRKRAWRDGV